MERRPEYARHQWRYLTDEAKIALDFARMDAAELGSISTGTVHLLLGLIREPNGLAGKVLAEFDLTGRRIRRL